MELNIHISQNIRNNVIRVRTDSIFVTCFQVVTCHNTSAQTCTNEHYNYVDSRWSHHFNTPAATNIRIKELHRCPSFANIWFSLNPHYTILFRPCRQSWTERNCRLIYALSPFSCFASCANHILYTEITNRAHKPRYIAYEPVHYTLFVTCCSGLATYLHKYKKNRSSEHRSTHMWDLTYI